MLCSWSMFEFFKMLIFVTTLLVIFSRSSALNYSEIQRLNVSCGEADTCNLAGIKHDTLEMRNCECGPYCVRYATCCIDSRYQKSQTTESLKASTRYSCIHVLNQHTANGLNIDVYMRARCEKRWQGDMKVKSLCQTSPTSVEDPVAWTPVTSLDTHITYRNYFCALCNSDLDNLLTWELKIIRVYPQIDSKLPDKVFATNDLVFNKTSNHWGIYDKSPGSTRSEFHSVNLQVLLPSNLDNVVRYCLRGRIKSTCAEGWTDQQTRNKCLSYMALLMPSSKTKEYDLYKNVHCAICNNERSRLYCPGRVAGWSDIFPKVSLTLLLDVNQKDGEKVGELNRCGKGKMYDPFAKNCRTLVCGLPGYIEKDGKCVRAQ